MDRNLILAIVISVLIIVGFQLYFQAVSKPQVKKPRKPVVTEETVQPAKPAPEVVARKPEQEPRVPSERISEPMPETAKPEPVRTGAPETTVKIETRQYEAVLSSRGGRIISFKLKQYKTSLGGTELVDLYDPRGPETGGPSILLTWQDRSLNDSALPYEYVSGETSISLKESGEKKSITFKASTAAGLKIAKTYTFTTEGYAVGVSYTLTNDSDQSRNYLVSFPWKTIYKGESSTSQFAWNSVEVFLNGKREDYYFKKITEDKDYSGQIKWAGLGDLYFFKCLVLGEKPAQRVTLFKPSPEGIAELWLRAGSLDLKAGESAPLNLIAYLGPKEHKALVDAGHELNKALYYAEYFVLDVTSQYLIEFLRFFNSGFTVLGIRIPGTHNWGLDIIILTLIIKILFIPLTHKSTKSMKRMQDLQPKIAELKEKFKDDKAALNKATMELFREHKVNPLGSCWPMLLQFPVFIGLYQILGYAIELRHAGFVCIPSIYLCLNDLSAPDPYYVTPILMGGSMVLQQWLTPAASADPTQRTMMMLMPLVFTYLFLSFPSGLVLYWLVNNLLSIGQQLITNSLTK